MKGRVIRVFAEKYFGFILGEDGKQYFFHRDDCYPGIWDNAKHLIKVGKNYDVEFEDGMTDKGLRARLVNDIEEVA